MAQFLTRISLALGAFASLALVACDSATPGADSLGDPDAATTGDVRADGTTADTATPGDDVAAADVPYVVPNPDGKQHGEPCIDAAECQFLACIDAPSLTGGAFKICTKDCSEGPNAPCNLEGTDFTCARTSASAGDDLTAFCTRSCASLSDCPPGYGSCRQVSYSALKLCTVP